MDEHAKYVAEALLAPKMSNNAHFWLLTNVDYSNKNNEVNSNLLFLFFIFLMSGFFIVSHPLYNIFFLKIFIQIRFFIIKKPDLAENQHIKKRRLFKLKKKF